ncbi:MAG: flagellar M-ring protein FliF C-terminal domain-containing protein, partial [Brevundimonas sp.]
TYEARTPEEIAQIRALVAAAVGIDETRGDKIEVVNVRFNRDTGLPGGLDGAASSMFDFGKNDIMRGVELLVLLVTGLMLIFFVLRPLLKTAGSAASPPALIAADGTPVTALQTTVVGPDGQAALLPAPNDMEQRLDIARIEGQVKASSVRKVAEFVDGHPDEAVGILRTWIQES